MYGLITAPVAGWTAGTALGAHLRTSGRVGGKRHGDRSVRDVYRDYHSAGEKVQACRLYDSAICSGHGGSEYDPAFSVISEGFRVIIATFAAAGTAAVLFPVREEKCVSEPSHAAEESIRTSGAKRDDGF